MATGFPEIPDFLRAYGIRKDVLQEAIRVISQTDNPELERKLRHILIPPNRGAASPKIEARAPDRKARLTRKLKENTVLTIVRLIDDGHSTFARLRKSSGIDDRILKSAIRYGLAHDVSGYRLTKISGKVYGVHRR
mgnify:CR=1 FL=1